MRNPFTGAIAGLAVLILSSIAMTQPQQGTYEAPCGNMTVATEALVRAGPLLCMI